MSEAPVTPVVPTVVTPVVPPVELGSTGDRVKDRVKDRVNAREEYNRAHQRSFDANPFDTRHEDREEAKRRAEAAPLTKDEAVAIAKMLRPDQGRDRMLRFLGADPTTLRNISDGRENRPAEAVKAAQAEASGKAHLGDNEVERVRRERVERERLGNMPSADPAYK